MTSHLLRRTGLAAAGLLIAVAGCTSASATPIPTVALTFTPPAPTATLSLTPAPPTPTPTLAPTPTPTLAPTLAPAPPAAPTAVTMADLTPPATCPAAFGASCFAYKVTWTEPDPAGVTLTAYAVTKCLAKPRCVAATTPITAADLYSLGTASASTGSLSFVVGDGESNGDGWVMSGSTTLYLYAVVVQASSSSGKSPFVVAWSW
jgi:hypothetical protein